MKLECKYYFIFLILALLSYECTAYDQYEENDLWLQATATFYGGSLDGACGYGSDVESPPMAGRSTAVGNFLYDNGGGCGSCFQVKCMEPGVCNEAGATVIAVDKCPGCRGSHFDLFWSALPSLAFSNKVPQLVSKGFFNVMYKRVPCKCRGKSMSFKVNARSNPYWFEVMVMYVEGEGEVVGLELRERGSAEWMKMYRVWGANWVLRNFKPLQPPFSFRVSLTFGQSHTFETVIPSTWYPGGVYTSS